MLENESLFFFPVAAGKNELHHLCFFRRDSVLEFFQKDSGRGFPEFRPAFRIHFVQEVMIIEPLQNMAE